MQATHPSDTAASIPQIHCRAVRSYVKRGGRIGPGQRRALDTWGPQYLFEGPIVPAMAPLDFERLFGRQSPVLLEIGFGMGEATAALAAQRPDWNLLAVEVHEPGIGSLLKQLGQAGLDNVRIVAHDAVELLRCGIAPDSLDAVHIYFPDPWPKKRHHKRRLVQPAFIADLCIRMKPGAYLHLATDWQHYAQHMLAVLQAEPRLRNLHPERADGYAPKPSWRPPSKFEQRGLRLGHGVWDLLFERI
jgi:tRNA (guanine-N7-)-methyltransferase